MSTRYKETILKFQIAVSECINDNNHDKKVREFFRNIADLITRFTLGTDTRIPSNFLGLGGNYFSQNSGRAIMLS